MPLALFCLYFLKVTALPISYPEVLILLILGATASFFEFKNNEKKIRQLEETIKTTLNQFEEKVKQIDHIKGSF